MVKKKTLKITIDPNGVVQIDVQGAAGSECLKWTETLERDLGGVVSREMKSEFYEQIQVSQEIGDSDVGN